MLRVFSEEFNVSQAPRLAPLHERSPAVQVMRRYAKICPFVLVSVSGFEFARCPGLGLRCARSEEKDTLVATVSSRRTSYRWIGAPKSIPRFTAIELPVFLDEQPSIETKGTADCRSRTSFCIPSENSELDWRSRCTTPGSVHVPRRYSFLS